MFVENHFHTFLKTHKTRLLPFQDVFWNPVKPGFCHSKMFCLNSCPHLPKILWNQTSAFPRRLWKIISTCWKSSDTRLLPFQDVFSKMISTCPKSRAPVVWENHCYLLKSSHLSTGAVWIYNDFHPHSTKNLLRLKDLFVNDFSCQNI